jgi:hypothetical protein
MPRSIEKLLDRLAEVNPVHVGAPELRALIAVARFGKVASTAFWAQLIYIKDEESRNRMAERIEKFDTKLDTLQAVLEREVGDD